MDDDSPAGRFRQLLDYVGWTDVDAVVIRSIAPDLEPTFDAIISDFYEQIDRHPRLRALMTGGDAQILRLKTTLRCWLAGLFSGSYDDHYVQQRWQVGIRHAEIGLEQVYCIAAMSRIRIHLLDALLGLKDLDPTLIQTAASALNKLLDLELAIIDDAYQTEWLARQQRIERLATLGQISGGLTHELRNPLNVIKTSVYYLLHARQPTDEKRVEHLQRIERQVELADGVISALASFAGSPRPDPQPFSIDACIREVLEQTSLPPSIEVTTAGIEDLPLVAADAKQVQIVLSNLIRNARDAMSGTGRLTLTGTTERTMVEIGVSDSGPGVPVDQLRRIMEPFYTTKARGLGLGLAISRSIVERNHGELLVKSQVGQGSTFLVRLPAATPAQADTAATESP
jgi:two-component system, NtrC family, sensor kinase